MTEYSLTIVVDDQQTWNDLKGGAYKLYLGKPGDPANIPVHSDLGGETKSYDLPEASPVTVLWKSNDTAIAQYSISYKLKGDVDLSNVPNPIDVDFGDAVELKEGKFESRRGPLSWVPSDTLGFKNDITALPLVYPRGIISPISNPGASLWVPGQGTLKPRTKDQVYAWFYSDSVGENDDVDTEDFSYTKLLKFTTGRNISITYNDASWGTQSYTT